MILSTQNSLFKFKYPVEDLISPVVKKTQYAMRARKTADGVNSIEDGAIDEEDKELIESFIKQGTLRAHEVLTFLSQDIDKPYSWKEAGTESRQAVVYTINQETWMATNIAVLLDEAIYNVIIEYALYQWYKSNGMYQDASIHLQSYEDAMTDLRRNSRLRRTAASRPIQILP